MSSGCQHYAGNRFFIQIGHQAECVYNPTSRFMLSAGLQVHVDGPNLHFPDTVRDVCEKANGSTFYIKQQSNQKPYDSFGLNL